MTEHPNITVFEEVYASFKEGDMEKLGKLIAPDVV